MDKRPRNDEKMLTPEERVSKAALGLRAAQEEVQQAAAIMEATTAAIRALGENLPQMEKLCGELLDLITSTMLIVWAALNSGHEGAETPAGSSPPGGEPVESIWPDKEFKNLGQFAKHISERFGIPMSAVRKALGKSLREAMTIEEAKMAVETMLHNRAGGLHA